MLTRNRRNPNVILRNRTSLLAQVELHPRIKHCAFRIAGKDRDGLGELVQTRKVLFHSGRCEGAITQLPNHWHTEEYCRLACDHLHHRRLPGEKRNHSVRVQQCPTIHSRPLARNRSVWPLPSFADRRQGSIPRIAALPPGYLILQRDLGGDCTRLSTSPPGCDNALECLAFREESSPSFPGGLDRPADRASFDLVLCCAACDTEQGWDGSRRRSDSQYAAKLRGGHHGTPAVHDRVFRPD